MLERLHVSKVEAGRQRRAHVLRTQGAKGGAMILTEVLPQALELLIRHHIVGRHRLLDEMRIEVDHPTLGVRKIFKADQVQRFVVLSASNSHVLCNFKQIFDLG